MLTDVEEPMSTGGIAAFLAKHGVDFEAEIGDKLTKEWRKFSFQSKSDPLMVIRFEARRLVHTDEFRISLGEFR